MSWHYEAKPNVRYEDLKVTVPLNALAGKGKLEALKFAQQEGYALLKENVLSEDELFRASDYLMQVSMALRDRAVQAEMTRLQASLNEWRAAGCPGKDPIEAERTPRAPAPPRIDTARAKADLLAAFGKVSL